MSIRGNRKDLGMVAALAALYFVIATLAMVVPIAQTCGRLDPAAALRVGSRRRQSAGGCHKMACTP